MNYTTSVYTKPVKEFDAFELGPRLESKAVDFTLPDHNSIPTSLESLIGTNGLLLGFIGDIWQPASVRRILWLQKNVGKFAMMGTSAALLVRDHAHTLYGFRSSSPLPVPFPLLSDLDGAVHKSYIMDTAPGLLLIDAQRIIRFKWLMPDETVWPRVPELVQAVQTLQVYA